MIKKSFGCAVLLLCIIAAPLRAMAQSTSGSISGTVTDESKAVLPGVTISVENLDTGAQRTLATDQDGRYLFLSNGERVAGAGRITELATPARQVQLGIKLIF